MIPAIPITRDGNFNSSPSIMKLKPMADITSKISKRKCISNHKAKFIIVNSMITSQIPLVSRNLLLSERLLLLLYAIYADNPDKKTKVGAQRCVIQRVINNAVVVV